MVIQLKQFNTMGSDDNWRTQSFRQSVVSKIEEVIQRSGMQVARNSSDIESHVFMKAKTREEYMNMVILHVRELCTSDTVENMKRNHPEKLEMINQNQAAEVTSPSVVDIVTGASVSSTSTKNAINLYEFGRNVEDPKNLKSNHLEELEAINQNQDHEVFSPSSLSSMSSESEVELSESDVDDPLKVGYLLAEMIAVDNVPLSIEERTGFARLFKQALPQHYSMPSNYEIARDLFPDIYLRIFKRIKGSISKASVFSVTLNIWTCESLYFDSYMSFTAHWLTPEFQLKHGVLAVKPFEFAYTEENVAKELEQILANWNIDQSKIHLLLHYSGGANAIERQILPNTVNYVRVADFDNPTCFVHLLQGIITDSLSTEPEVVRMMNTARFVMSYLNDSMRALEILPLIQRELDLPELRLVKDIKTRWNSTYYMAERLMEIKQAICNYLDNHDHCIRAPENLAPEQWCLMEQYLMLLKPFEEIIRKTSSGISCMSEVIPHVAALINYLNKDEIVQRSPNLPKLRDSLKVELENVLSRLRKNPNYLIATFLDPRFNASYLGAVEAETARQKIVLDYLKMYSEKPSTNSRCSSAPTPAKRSRDDATLSNVSRKTQDIFWECFNEVANKKNMDQIKNEIETDIGSYLKGARIDRNCDPYTWWSSHLQQYPKLNKFVQIYLSAPCSSVYGERLFSEPGLGYENKHNRLLKLLSEADHGNGANYDLAVKLFSKPGHNYGAKHHRLFPLEAQKRLFVHHNLPLVNFKY